MGELCTVCFFFVCDFFAVEKGGGGGGVVARTHTRSIVLRKCVRTVLPVSELFSVALAVFRRTSCVRRARLGLFLASYL